MTAPLSESAAGAGAATPGEPGPGAPLLLLFSRRGCCLCEGLEERLRALSLPMALLLLDVDADPMLRERYDLRVPVLALSEGSAGWRELPAVPPRLAGQRLEAWLASHGAVGGAAAGTEPGPAGGL